VLSFFLEGADAGSELAPALSELLVALGEVVGTAIESTRRADLNVYASVMQERHLLANEVHDSLAQNLTSIRMRTSLLRDAVGRQQGERAAQYLREIDEALAVAQSRVREIITQFRAQMDAPRLVPALEFAVDELRAASGIEIELVNRLREPKLSPYEEVQVFYIAREALTNALKHAHPNCVRVVLAQHPAGFELLVEDDGVGMDSGRASDYGHFGLNIMRERAQRLGGRIDLEHCPGGGTRVRLAFPLRGGFEEAAA
jgi:nitrate/nitrite-specific signal transduction histidine kinase